jgi:hypothetical protein
MIMGRRRADVLEDTLDEALAGAAALEDVDVDDDEDSDWVHAPALARRRSVGFAGRRRVDDEDEAPKEPPVSEVLGARTLAGLKAKMRKEPLSKSGERVARHHAPSRR